MIFGQLLWAYNNIKTHVEKIIKVDVPDTPQYKQIGNAVPVNLGYYIGMCVRRMLLEGGLI